MSPYYHLVPSPSFVLEEDRLKENLRLIAQVQAEAEVKNHFGLERICDVESLSFGKAIPKWCYRQLLK